MNISCEVFRICYADSVFSCSTRSHLSRISADKRNKEYGCMPLMTAAAAPQFAPAGDVFDSIVCGANQNSENCSPER
jgi:hypothetical protein